MLEEAKRLHDLGFGVHWIKKNSKAPVKARWSQPGRDSWKELKASYRTGYGLGVRLGESSRANGDQYLANIDVDIKSANPRHRQEALNKLDEYFPGIRESAPYVKTGYGRRYFVALKKPVTSMTIAASEDETVVFMPSAEINKKQQEALAKGMISEDQLQQGYRVRAAWEVDFMSLGKQVVLPPSIHPDTKKAYIWKRPIAGEIPTVELRPEDVGGRTDSSPQKTNDPTKFKAEEVDISRLPEKYRQMIETGEGVTDRSAACFSVALAMIKRKYTDNQVLSLLTDKTNYLGDCAFEHAGQTKSRARAALWVEKYCIAKARMQTDAANVFRDLVTVTPTLKSKEDRDAQKEEIVYRAGWEDQIIRHKTKEGEPPGPPVAEMVNIVWIISNAVGENTFRRDTFANRDIYGCDTPWGGREGDSIIDDDTIKVKEWIKKEYNCTAAKPVIEDAIVCIALKNEHHPVQEQLNDLPDWDGVNRLDGWLKENFNAEGPDYYLADVFRKWMVASVTRTFEPGAKYDDVLILEGLEGLGKSTFGELLFGEKYFIDRLPDLHDKDAALNLQGLRVVELAELASFKKSDTETIKGFISRRIDKVRAPFGKRWMEYKRGCVFYGTTNAEKFLRDENGNRRYNPVKINGKLKRKKLVRERDQLWAEAMFIYMNGLEPRLDLQGRARDYAILMQQDKMVQDDSHLMADDMIDFVQREMRKTTKDRFDFSRFELKSLFTDFGPFNRHRDEKRTQQLAAKAIKSLGATKVKTKVKVYWTIDAKAVLANL